MGIQTAIPHGYRIRGNMLSLFGPGGVRAGPIQKDGPLARSVEWHPHQLLVSDRVRILISAIVIFALWFTCDFARASRLDDSPTDLAALQVKADKAKPRDRCFLYAELVHNLAELAAQQFNSGDAESVAETLKQVQSFAVKVQVDAADDSRNLVDAELLMRRTVLRLTGVLRRASEEDRPALKMALKQLNLAHALLMMQVFEK